jgi:hypothetical protein
MPLKTDQIKTTGDLRDFLARAITETRAGTLGIEEAGKVAKIAAQINESFYAEVKIQRTQKELGRVVTEMGHLEVGGGND